MSTKLLLRIDFRWVSMGIFNIPAVSTPPGPSWHARYTGIEHEIYGNESRKPDQWASRRWSRVTINT